MSELLQFALVTFTSVLFIVDPIAVIPTYLVITQDETPAQRAITARRACIARHVSASGRRAGGPGKAFSGRPHAVLPGLILHQDRG